MNKINWVIAGAALWLLLAFVAWHYESTCGVFFSGACFASYWDGLRWVVLAKWIHPYQTLIGGIAALAAGMFVLIAARQTSEDSRNAEHARQRRNGAVACSIVADEFRDAQIETRAAFRSFPFDVIPKPLFLQASTYIPSLHFIDPMLGSIASAAKRDVEDYLSNGSSKSLTEARLASAKCYAVWRILLYISDNLSDEGRFDLRSGEKIPAGDLPSILAGLSVLPTQLIGLYALFDWETANSSSSNGTSDSDVR